MRNVFTFSMGALLVAAIIVIYSYVAIKVAKRAPAALVRVLVTLTLTLGAIPAILYALYGA
ncbi:hypothetical protein AB0K18_09025 [Nonomuraea sp. NPDC049421]|uniref:hypothetical protein n=1 Tax=Nonomuraea sp. NPDC049421 TaxID=3155275 RepID=UPI003417AC16